MRFVIVKGACSKAISDSRANAAKNGSIGVQLHQDPPHTARDSGHGRVRKFRNSAGSGPRLGALENLLTPDNTQLSQPKRLLNQSRVERLAERRNETLGKPDAMEPTSRPPILPPLLISRLDGSISHARVRLVAIGTSFRFPVTYPRASRGYYRQSAGDGRSNRA